MLRTLWLVFALMISSLAWAQDNYVPGTQAKPILFGIKGKNAGDIIAPQFDNEIAAWCDFAKQIVITRTGIMCVYNGKG